MKREVLTPHQAFDGKIVDKVIIFPLFYAGIEYYYPISVIVECTFVGCWLEKVYFVKAFC